jgi:hypothetical protein
MAITTGPADHRFHATAEERGWAEPTQVFLLLQFIEQHRLTAALADYLADVVAAEVDDEDSHTPIADHPSRSNTL